MKPAYLASLIATSGFAIPGLCQLAAVTGRLSGSVAGLAQTNAGLDATVRGGTQPVDAAASVTESAALRTRLDSLLPAGTNAIQAAAGFKDAGQFAAAVHAAHNLNIPFAGLQACMTGKHAESLEKAVHALRPDLDSRDLKDHVRLAESESAYDFTRISATGKDRTAASATSDTHIHAFAASALPRGTDIYSAAAGFHSKAQFAATVDASKNLDIPFAELKDRITAGQTLGEAIHSAKPSIDRTTADMRAHESEEHSRQIEANVSVSAEARH